MLKACTSSQKVIFIWRPQFTLPKRKPKRKQYECHFNYDQLMASDIRCERCKCSSGKVYVYMFVLKIYSIVHCVYNHNLVCSVIFFREYHVFRKIIHFGEIHYILSVYGSQPERRDFSAPKAIIRRYTCKFSLLKMQRTTWPHIPFCGWNGKTSPLPHLVMLSFSY